MKCLVFLLLMSSAAWSQSGLKTVKDKTGACQISIPASWTILSTPGHFSAPEHTESMILVAHRPYRPFDQETLQVLHVGKVYENSKQRALWVTKPNSGNPPLVTYHVEAPGKGNACVAEVTVTQSHAEAEARQVALSLSAAN